jgi:hypothetical protein
VRYGQTTRCSIRQAQRRYVALFPASCAVTLFYVALFVACLTGVCALVVIGDKLGRVYVDWRKRGDSFRNEPAPAASLRPQSASL